MTHGNPKIAIAVAQMDCVVGETAPNLNKIRHFAGLAANLGADLAIFPECCTTGYFVGDRLSTLAEPDDGATAKQLGDIARDRKLHLAIGMFTKDGNAIRNSQLLFAPDGKRLATYHKTSPVRERTRILPTRRPSGGSRHRAGQDRYDHLL